MTEPLPRNPSAPRLLGRALAAGVVGGALLGATAAGVTGQNFHLAVLLIGAAIGAGSSVPVSASAAGLWLMLRRMGAGRTVRRVFAALAAGLMSYVAMVIGNGDLPLLRVGTVLYPAAAIVVALVTEPWIGRE